LGKWYHIPASGQAKPVREADHAARDHRKLLEKEQKPLTFPVGGFFGVKVCQRMERAAGTL
jgi:hypothetical protein